MIVKADHARTLDVMSSQRAAFARITREQILADGRSLENKSETPAELQTRALRNFLMTVGVLGCVLVVFGAAVFPLIAVMDPKMSEVLVIASMGIPFVIYIVAVRKRWGRNLTLAAGVPAHAPWLVFVRHPVELAVFLAAAVVMFGLFVWYALRLPPVEDKPQLPD